MPLGQGVVMADTPHPSMIIILIYIVASVMISRPNGQRLRIASRMSRSRSVMRLPLLAGCLRVNCSRLRVRPAIICFISCSVMVIHPVIALRGGFFLLPELSGLALLFGHRVSRGGLA